jgi:Uma2 family endonuclease
MSTITTTPALPPAAPAPTAAVPCAVEIAGHVRIPAGITDLASYRRWTHSDDFPERGRFAYLAGTIWVDLDMEQAYFHNDVKEEICSRLRDLARSTRLGRYFGDGMQLSIPAVDLTTVPDGIFVTYDAFSSGRLREVPSVRQVGVVEFEGVPDLVLEVVSASSVDKDTVTLPPLYQRAGIVEFWRVDARNELTFEIFRLVGGVYQPTRQPDGWWRSDLFGLSFQLTRGSDPVGKPEFTLEARP